MSSTSKSRDLRGFGAPTRSTSTVDDLYEPSFVDDLDISVAKSSEEGHAASSPTAIMDSMADLLLTSTSMALHTTGFVDRLKERLEVEQTQRAFRIMFAHPPRIDFLPWYQERGPWRWFTEPEEEVSVDTISTADIDSVAYTSDVAYRSRAVDFEPIEE